MKTRSLISKIKNIGVYNSTPIDEIKRIKLLNICCISWLSFLVLFILSDQFTRESPSIHQLVNGISTALVFLILYLQHIGRFYIARILYITVTLVVYIFTALLLDPNTFREYFLILIPILSLLFIDKKWINISVLAISYAAFIVPIYFFGFYKDANIDPINTLILFLAVFIIVNYFKNLNIKSETLLLRQKNQAIIDKEKIEKQQEKLKELYAFQNHFMVNLSHEIRTPLTLIKGTSSQLRQSRTLEQTQTIYDQIDNNSDKIKHLVDNIIDLAKMNAKKLELNKRLFLAIPFIVKTVASFDAFFAQKEILFRLNNLVLNDNLFINGDKSYLERAISNLMMNAQKYCEKGAHVTITLKNNGNYLIFEIQDSGIGIPNTELSNIFKPFYRAQNSINQAGGSGVGLSFSKEVIELHAGKITVESIENKGSCFRVALPVLETEKSFSLHNNSSQSIETKFNQYSILLVEDNIEMQQYLKSVLSSFKVTTANNGKEALGILSGETFRLIVTDFMMPIMDGFEFIQQVKNIGIDVPVIVLTARMDEKGKMDFLRLGIDDYLTKPFNEEELLIRIEHSLTNFSEKTALEEQEPTDETKDFTHEVKKVVMDNISSATFGVMDLAESMAMADRTLNRKLKSLTGLTPNGFIREIKLQEAKALLENDAALTIKQLTLSLGFKNSSHFASLYENRFGKRPFD